jgi:4'-phosphopantetheinyl transferase EntD
VIEELLPARVACADTFTDPPDAWLYPEEEAAIAKAVDKRRREYTTARHCARRALAALGLPPVPLPSEPRGGPRWPPGIVGSITHCEGYRAAVVARDTDLTSVGIDAEPAGPLPEGVLELVTGPAERVALAALAAAQPDVAWDRLIFSAKESVFKAWYPLARRWLGFEDAEVTLDPAGTFAARLLVPPIPVGGGELAGFAGRWLTRRDLVLTAIAVAI